MIRRVVMLAAVVIGATTLASCSEQLEGDSACPILCPQENLNVQQTVLLDGVVLDTTIGGFPEVGAESRLLLVNRGDTLETRAVIRYDELPNTYRDENGVETDITEVFDAALVAKVVSPALNPDAPVEIDVFDVDAPTTDTVPSELLPYFRQERRIGGTTVVPAELADSVLRIPLSDSAVLAKISAGQRLRVGIMVKGEQSVQLHIASAGNISTLLSFRVNSDSTVTCCVKSPVFPTSTTPAGLPFISSLLHDFIIVARRALPEVPEGTLAVGGPTGRRAYLRFSIPKQVLDANILRATLLLTQQPNPGAAGPGDTVAVQVTVPAARDPITELSRQISLVIPLHQAAGLLAPTASDLFIVRPREEGLREIELVGLARRWRSTLTDSSSRAIVLRAVGEGEEGGEILFYSTEAPAELRPRLRITFVPPGGFGTP